MIDELKGWISGATATACRAMMILACLTLVWGVAAVAMVVPAVAWCALALLAWWRLRRPGAVSDSYGTARTASVSDMENGGLLSDSGLILGRCQVERPPLAAGIAALFSPRTGSDIACRSFLAAGFGGRWLGDRLMRVKDYVHLVTCSPPGGGKAIAAMIPALLSHRGNCVVVDPKGELYAATAEHRRRAFGHKIFRLDPFDPRRLGPGDCLNPLDFISDKDEFLDSCRDLADMLVIREDDEKDPHWNESACSVLCAFIAFVAGCEHDPERRHLGTVRALVSSRAKYASAIEAMQQSDDCQGVIRRLGEELTWHVDEELASVQSTVSRHSNFMDSPAVARNLASTSFDPMILRTGRATVYLILPAARLQSLSRLQRLWIGCIMRRVTSGVPTEKNPVLWLLDEYAHVGRMQAVEDAVTLMRGMGMRLWFVFQSLNQIKTCFGEKAATVIDAVATRQYFGITSYETAEEISKRIGDATVAIETGGFTEQWQRSTGVSKEPQPGSHSRSTTLNRSEVARKLLFPDEVLRLHPDVCLVFHKHLPVCIGTLCKWFEAPEFKNGGTGRSQRLGVAAAVLAAFLLVAAGAGARFAQGVASMPPDGGRSVPAVYRRQSSGKIKRQGGARPALYRPAPRYGAGGYWINTGSSVR
jgi:type IV secretion system protein VirD4